MRRNIPDETTPTDTIDTNSNSNNSGSHYSLSSTISSTISTNNTNTNVNSNSNNNMQQIPGHHHDEDVVYVQQSAAGTSSSSTLGIMNTRANKHMNSMNASRVTIHHVDNGTNTNNDDDDDDDDYNPLLQTNFDIEPLIAKVVPANSYSYSHSNSSSPLNLPSHSTVLNTDADATNKYSSSPQTTNPATLSANNTRKRKTKTVFKKPFFAFQQIGTTNSRKGKYVRTTFEQSVTSYIYDKRKRMRLLVILFGLIIIFSFVRYHNHHASFNGYNKNDDNGTGNSNNSGSSSHSHHGDENDDYYNNNIDDDYSITDDNYHITIPNADKYQQQNHIGTNNNIKSNNLNIDHWCRNGEKYQTSCSSCSGQPIKPQDKLYSSLWKDALELNVDLIQNYIYNSSSSSSSSQYYKNHHHSKKNNHQKQSNKNENIDSQLDVVFYGDSIIEEWNGRWMGMQNSEKLEIHKVWKSYFERIQSIDGDTAATVVNDSSGNNDDNDNDDDADIGNGNKDDIENIDITLNGLALGIAGDRINNLLWRITNGNELPQELYARVFWIVIGTNDLSAGCSEEIVLVGIINIIQTLRKLRPDSIIVINGLLPRTDRTSGKLVGVNSSTMSATASISSSHDDVDTATDIDGSFSANASTADDDKDFDDDYNYDESNMSSSKSTSGRQNSSIHDNRNDDDDDEGEGEGEDEKKSDYWPSIQAINKQLQKYARRHEKVEYFDPSHLFIAQLQTDTYQQKDKYLLEELQDDYLHPSSLGHEIWAKAILDYFVSDLDTPDYLQRR